MMTRAEREALRDSIYRRAFTQQESHAILDAFSARATTSRRSATSPRFTSRWSTSSRSISSRAEAACAVMRRAITEYDDADGAISKDGMRAALAGPEHSPTHTDLMVTPEAIDADTKGGG